MIVAGLGFRRGVMAEEIEAVIALALDRAGASIHGSQTRHREAAGAGALDALATLADKAREPGLREAARRLSLPVLPCSREAMMAVQDRIVTFSARAEASVGLPSVAEAAALVAAGPSSVLLLPRVATANATCAIAGGSSP